MPNNDYISKLLEIKDLIVENIDNTNEGVHIYFKLERRDHQFLATAYYLKEEVF